MLQFQIKQVDGEAPFEASFGSYVERGTSAMDAVKNLNDTIARTAQMALQAHHETDHAVRAWHEQLMRGYAAGPVIDDWSSLRVDERVFLQVRDDKGVERQDLAGVWIYAGSQVVPVEAGDHPEGATATVFTFTNRLNQRLQVGEGDGRVRLKRILLPVTTAEGDRFYDGAGQLVQPIVPAEIVGFGGLVVAAEQADGTGKGFMLQFHTRNGSVNLFLPADHSQQLINAIDEVVGTQQQVPVADNDLARAASGATDGEDDEVFEAAAAAGASVSPQDVRAQAEAIVSGNAAERVTGVPCGSAGCCGSVPNHMMPQQTQVPVNAEPVEIRDNDGEAATVDEVVAQTTAAPGAWALGLDKPLPPMPAPGEYREGEIVIVYANKQWWRGKIERVHARESGRMYEVDYFAPGGVKAGTVQVSDRENRLQRPAH